MSPPPPDPALLNPTAVGGRRFLAFLIDALIGTALIFVYAAATFTNTEFDNDFTAALQCDVINELSNDVCIQAGSTVYVGDGGDMGVIVLLWLLWVVLSTMVIPGITGWSPGKRCSKSAVTPCRAAQHHAQNMRVDGGIFPCLSGGPICLIQ